MPRRTRTRVLAAVTAAAAAAATAACGEAPQRQAGGSAGPQYTACMVTDIGGIDDRSFNTAAWRGMQNAAKEHTAVEPKYVASTAESAYEPNLTQYVNQKCNFILAVGGLMANATSKIAKANPNQEFGIVDAKLPETNVYPMQFDTAQAGFLAGYLAAGMSKSGKVGTYGGLPIPP
ncbi:MAG TPA: BMP family ABC transporter substrate-binding protein, partial [Pilimelia sp.]|nr:BMP family ABC transporter substrate-binding protein [Pilimelia sp.]